MRSTWPVARWAPSAHPGLDGSGPHSGRVGEADGVGALREPPSTLRPEYPAALCAVAAERARGGAAPLCALDPERASHVGEACAVTSVGHHEVVESLLYQSDLSPLSGASGTAGVAGAGTWQQ
jgi:hypothetical protein